MVAVHIHDFAGLVSDAKRRSGLGALLGLVIKTKLFRFIAERKAIARIDSFSKGIERQILVYNGLIRVLSQGLSKIDTQDQDNLVAALEAAEADYLDMRSDMFDLLNTAKGWSALERAIKAYIGVLVDCFEIAQETRWTILELQAQSDIDSGRVTTFNSFEDAISSLGS